jgi:Zn-dependent M16 (insulinase) family peptidase
VRANRHRTVLVLKPDRDLAEREALEERARLEEARTCVIRSDFACNFGPGG